MFLRDFYRKSVTPEQERAEATAVSAARLVVYSSQYMADRASAEFGGDLRDKVAVIPFGANCGKAPPTLTPKTPLGPVRLLWVGSNWQRKGGEIALAAHHLLRAAGLDAELTLAGDVPAEVKARPGLVVAGYLDKNRRREAARLEALYASAHLLVLPTRADCTPMVLAEAGTFGTPVLATDTGGIGTLVAPGVNGRLMPPAAVPADWARAIMAMTRDPAAYEALCRSSFDFARSRLTWSAWSRDLVLRLRMELAVPAVGQAA
jgi:glycosyltransferase involved in cell wall biosynthesis